jgi:hypothetical protein
LMVLEVTQRILDYDNYLSESEYLDEVAAKVDADDLFGGVVELLKSSDEQTLSTTLLFVQDIIQWYPGEERQSIKEKYPESIVVRAIENLLYYPAHWVRKQAGYVLGKTCSYGSLPAMTEAFHHWYERDPLMMRHFVGELGWLGAENFDELIEKMMTSSYFVTRWISLLFQEELHKDDDMQSREHKQQRWDRLRNDVNPLIRQEAEYEYQIQLFRLTRNSLSKEEQQREISYKKARKIIEETFKSSVSIEIIRGKFESHLYQSGLADYTIDQLEAFIADYVTRLDEK